MRYIFRILILGNSDLSLPYVSTALNEMGKDKDTYMKWNREIHILENVCELEIDVITSLTANFDEIIPNVDGILYFMNPLDEEQSELFNIILEIFKKIKRDIPTVLMYNNEDGILSKSTIELLEESWIKYPNFETFINLHPKDFRQALHCLASAMISGDKPLNLENAWLRFPILIMQANFYYNQKNFFEAAKAIKKAAFISNVFNKEEYYIISEQAAYLYSQLNLFLEAAKILDSVNNKKANEYKRLYAETMIREGNKLFNKGDYEFSARQYENAAQWSLIELKDKDLIIKSFRLAINSWISACRVENAFTILERLPHEQIKQTLEDLIEKVLSAADYLVSIGNLEAAREQLYISIHTYQREGLFEAMERFTHKLTNILIKILQKNIQDEQTYDAKRTYDEIENLWEAFNVEKVNLDESLEEIIRQFLHKHDFGMASYLLNELNSLELKKNLTEVSSDVEEKIKSLRKEALQKDLRIGVETIRSFRQVEIMIIEDINNTKLEKAEKFSKTNDHMKAAKYLELHSEYLTNIGEKKLADQILCEAMNILLEANQLEELFNLYFKIETEQIQKDYLIFVFSSLIESFKEISTLYGYEKVEDLLEKANFVYRDQMLYEKSQESSKLFINIIKSEALNAIEVGNNRSSIIYAVDLIKKAKNIANAYLEDYEPDFDELNKAISELYIEMGDLSSALSYLDKIEDKFYKKQVYNKLSATEEEKIASRAKEIETTLKKKSLQERHSIIKKKSQDARLDKEFEFRQRRGLKRAYFKEALNFLENENYQNAVEIYQKTLDKLNELRKYYLAAVSFAVICLIKMKQENMNEFIKYTKKKTKSNQLFLDTFPILLIEYIIDLYKVKDDEKLNQALSFMEELPLFEEEKKILYDLLGIDYAKISKPQVREKITINKEELKNTIINLSEAISNEKEDIAKRKLMKHRYYVPIIENISEQNYLEAASSYLKLIPELYEKGFNKHAGICLIISSLIYLFNEREEIAFDNLDQYYKKFPEIGKLPEVRLFIKLMDAWNANFDDLISMTLKIYSEKLILFTPEYELIRSYLEKEKKGEVQEKILSREERGEKSKIFLEMDQKIDILNQKLKDNKSEFQEIFKKRKALKKRYYQDILKDLTDDEYKKASEKYLDLANKLSERKDYKMSSLMLLLYAISSKKADIDINEITLKVETYLKNLGISRKIVSELFQLMILDFIIDAWKYNIKKYLPVLNQMLRNLPLFEEEQKLVPI